jgi:hypothetical protein
MNLTPAEIDALQQGAIRIGLFVRLAVDPPLRCWLGLGAIRPGINAVDATDEVYSGFGQLLNIPAMHQFINGGADRIEMSLSGVDDRILGLASFANTVHGAACHVGFGLFDTAWSMLGPVKWTRRYMADYLRMAVTPAGTPNDQTSKSATLALASQTTGRRRPKRSYFTQQDQQARSDEMNPALATDSFCQWTPKYSIAGNKTWPKFA